MFRERDFDGSSDKGDQNKGKNTAGLGVALAPSTLSCAYNKKGEQGHKQLCLQLRLVSRLQRERERGRRERKKRERKRCRYRFSPFLFSLSRFAQRSSAVRIRNESLLHRSVLISNLLLVLSAVRACRFSFPSLPLTPSPLSFRFLRPPCALFRPNGPPARRCRWHPPFRAQGRAATSSWRPA